MTLWKVPKSSKSSKIKSMEMTLIDAQATVPSRYVKDFQDILKEDSVRRLSRFDHGLNIAGGFRCAKYEYKIVFESNTLIEAIFDFDIPNHIFEFTPFAEVTNYVANFDYCFDLRGHIIAYSDPIVDYGKKRISVELEDERADRLKVTLWGEHADGVLEYMDSIPTFPVVLIVQYVKYKKYYCCKECNKKVEEIKYFRGKKPNAEKQVVQSLRGRNVDAQKKISVEKKWMCGSSYRYMSGMHLVAGLQPYETGWFTISLTRLLVNYVRRLDVSNFNIRNSNSEISVARLTTKADIIKKYLDDVAEDQDIDPKMSAEYYQNLTPNQDSTAKTVVSCTDHNDMGLPGDDIVESPPSKNKLPASAAQESVKSKPNKRVKKL
ncbi:OLC1v1012409C1 [Oldenlandia corymbosa var. corymbosa]|uniref:OLC1v1012409C1 n=1 Tax=Oldenlandia corymbosa var. corymbosa TaxID=529605 RepID=A0AAV1DWJ2_OLDCO|nr:OLC1v1012409C1 [Oldenlandia corymbosa var. corymbosa]